MAEACVGKPTSLPPPPATLTTPLEKVVALLYELNSWTDDIAPHRTPQRFGNLAFRDWGARLDSRIQQLHADLLPEHLHPMIKELKPYLGDAFGSFTRIDYGSGHELSFFAWLGLLYRLSFFGVGQEVEEKLGLEVFPLYLMVVWRLQDRYGLEPAGSHGVWGLDDFQFLPYVLGAAQLRLQSTLRPSAIVPLSSHPRILNEQLSDRSPASLISTPLTLPSSLLVEGGGDVVVPNLYLTSLLRIQVLKRGPFHEHSPLLHDISTTVPNWVKVYTGMVKMYCAECLGKKVVVQHFPFGGVGWVWDDTPSLPAQSAGVGERGAGMALGGERGNLGSMGVPTTRMTGSGNRGGLGQALGLGPRVGQRPGAGAAMGAAMPGSRAMPQGTGTMVPPLPPMTGTAAPWAATRALPRSEHRDKERPF